jgi:hypothetical protein
LAHSGQAEAIKPGKIREAFHRADDILAGSNNRLPESMGPDDQSEQGKRVRYDE